MIIVTGSFVAREGCLAEAIALSLEHVRRSRLENGCVSHSVHQDVENPERVFFFEEWSDHEALMTHFSVPATRAFAKAASALAVAAPSISILEARAVKR